MDTLLDVTAQAVLATFRRLPVNVRKDLLKQLIDVVDQPITVAEDDAPRNGHAVTGAADEGNEFSLPMTPRFIRHTGPPRDRTQEFAWVAAHREEYAGQWVALTGERLLAHGTDMSEVHREAQEAGIVDAIILKVESRDALPFVGF